METWPAKSSLQGHPTPIHTARVYTPGKSSFHFSQRTSAILNRLPTALFGVRDARGGRVGWENPKFPSARVRGNPERTRARAPGVGTAGCLICSSVRDGPLAV